MSDSEKKTLKPKLFYYLEHKQSSCRLYKGTKTVSQNPGHVIVKCQNYGRGCYAYTKRLVARHHVHKNLELWSCSGCLDTIIKIDTNA